MPKRLRAAIKRVLLIVVILTETLSAQTAGIWKMNAAKSQHMEEELPRMLIVRLEPHPEGEAVTVWTTTAEGQSETDSFIQRYDGKDHSYPREERFDSFNATKLENGTVTVIFKKGGKVVLRQARRLTMGGQQMTIEYELLLKNGKWLQRTLVLDKQSD